MPGPEEFAAAARGYCALIDGANALERDDLIFRLEEHLVVLYGAAMRLPDEAADTEEVKESVLSPDEWWDLFKRLQAQLGEFDAYQLIFDPYEVGGDPIGASLADDMASLYQDLLSGLALFDAGEVANAAWEWRFGFAHHWGRHAAHAIYAVFLLTHSGSVNSVRHR